MPNIRIITPTAAPSGFQRPADLGPGLDLRGLAHGLDDLAREKQRQNDEFDVNAVNDMYATDFSPKIRGLLYDPQNGLMAKQGKDAVSALPDVQAQVDKVRTDTMAALGNEKQRKIFNSLAQRHLQAEMDGAFRHVSRENQVWQAATSDAVVSEKLTGAVDRYNDPVWVDSSIKSGLFEIQNYGQTHGQSAEVVEKRSKDFVRQTRTAVFERMLVADPMAAQDYLKQHSSDLAGPRMAVMEHQAKQAVLPIEARVLADGVIKSNVIPDVEAKVELASQKASSFDTTMQFIFAKEGGYNAKDGNSGAPVNFGINQKANPDIDVKNLTKDGATAIYRERYWNAIGGDNLPPALGLMAMDTAVNQGVSAAKKLLKDSGGDVAKFAELRREKYKEIVRGDPTLSRFKGQWLARVDAAEAQANAMPPDQPPPKAVDIKAQLPDLITKAEAEAEKTHPGDPVFRDMAVSQVKGYLNNIVAQQVAKQQQAHGAVIAAAMGAGRGSPKPTTLDELMAKPGVRESFVILPPESQRGVISLLNQNSDEATGRRTQVNHATLNDVFARINLPDGDPNKIVREAQLVPLFPQLGREGYEYAKKTLDQQETVGGRSKSKDMELAGQTAARIMGADTLVKYNETRQQEVPEAVYRFRLDLAAKVDAYEKAGKDPRTLFTPGTPDYALTRERVMSYLETPQQAIARQAASIQKGRSTGGRTSMGVIGEAQAATPPGALVARNPKTGETVYSTDGGKTWTKP